MARYTTRHRQQKRPSRYWKKRLKIWIFPIIGTGLLLICQRERLLEHLEDGDIVAIVLGKKYAVNATEYEEALRKWGLKTRVSRNPSLAGMLAFCQLQKTKKEIVGNVRSTFYMWAAIFGEAEKVKNYALYRHEGWPVFSTFNFTNPYLKARTFTELILYPN